MQRIPYFELGAIGDPITERGFRTLFRTCPRASDFAREAVNAVPEALAPAWGVSPAAIKVAILHEDGMYGQSVSASQEALLGARGLRLVEKIGYAARGAELAAAVHRLKSAGADVVLHTGFGNDIVVFYRAMREAGWRPRMVIGSGAGYSGVDTMRAVGPDFDGTVNVDFTQFEVNERMAPGVKQFADAYRRRYGSEPRSGHSLANYCRRAHLPRRGAAGRRHRSRQGPRRHAGDRPARRRHPHRLGRPLRRARPEHPSPAVRAAMAERQAGHRLSRRGGGGPGSGRSSARPAEGTPARQPPANGGSERLLRPFQQPRQEARLLRRRRRCRRLLACRRRRVALPGRAAAFFLRCSHCSRESPALAARFAS